MALVQKANVILEVDEEALPRFVDNGFDVLGDNGEVVKKAIPHDPAALRKALIEALQTIDNLKAEIASLKAPAVEEVKTTKRAKKSE